MHQSNAGYLPIPSTDHIPALYFSHVYIVFLTVKSFFMYRTTRPAIAVVVKTELAACRDKINVTDSGNLKLYDDIDKETVFM